MQIVARRHATGRRDMRFISGTRGQIVLRDKRKTPAAAGGLLDLGGIGVHRGEQVRVAGQRRLLPTLTAGGELRKPRLRPVDCGEVR
ncbi:hypothetical protein LJ655_16670 [Paraburkholderia sp. MMS20-SJTN17]|uniref:Uncharacterized protein n=1 Tax=Paraburkholderia translucens TaxID=2886945 RepID=A0ABS8KFE9_9BURK|nr:hypothetical protein [Paraburkholderia sp. MMS20-SJTN17]